MKMQDIVFEARRLLMSPDDIPAGFRHPKLMNLAQEYGRRLTERLHSAPSSKLLGPRDVVLQVVPKVLQGFWSPPRSTFLNMPSQMLNQMAVGVTKCVLAKVTTALSNVHHQVTFSCSIRDAMVLSIQEKVRQMYPAQDIRRRELNSFAAQILNTIADAAATDVVDGAETIHTLAGDVNEELGLEEDREPIQEPVSSPSPTPLTPSAGPSAKVSLEEEPFASSPNLEYNSAVVPALLSSVTTADEPPAITVTQDGLTISETDPVDLCKPETDCEDVELNGEQGPAVTLALPTRHDGPVVMTAAQDERTIRKCEVKRKRRVQPFLVQKQSDAAACLKTQTENAQNPYHNASLLEQSGLHRITLGTSTISSVSSARENLLARQTLEQNIVQTGATDLDVAMFHRDGGEDSDSDSDLSMDEERSLSIPSSESEDNVRLRGRIQRRFKRSNHSERLLTEPAHNGTKDLDGNDLLSYWPALEECETHSLQKWGSERPLGSDYSKDAANNNQTDAALTSGDENGLTQPNRHRKGILKNRIGCPPALQGLSSIGRTPSDLNWYRTSTLGHRGVPAASYGRMYSATGAGGGSGSLSQPGSRYSSREQLDSLSRRQLSRETLGRQAGEPVGVQGQTGPPAHRQRARLQGGLEWERGAGGMEGFLSGSRSHLNSLTRRQASSREHLGGALMSSRSREQLEPNGGGAQPCREWLRTLPPRQPAHPDQPPSSSPPPPISEEPPQEQLPPHVRGRLDSAPPCRYTGQTSATSHSISEVSPDSEANRSEGQS
ncbi:Cadherin EGF LAG seven-pass G-type receptor 3 [Dissostichus eleginoides]|uniref:Cadherin EGF LAG seven-pass G-type receptor 3 n=1 Tax=Dissostichus eleginoides TaxID=100907 RepID=A0AAD9CBB8_DISEL|nr:Cadherin EGF LAG seven-pass G-type receptor 3 [Dissostichus eleginoides]